MKFRVVNDIRFFDISTINLYRSSFDISTIEKYRFGFDISIFISKKYRFENDPIKLFSCVLTIYSRVLYVSNII